MFSSLILATRKQVLQ